MLIVFSGTDGAGKSTQIRELKKYFSSKEKKLNVIWARGGYTPGFEFLKGLIRKLSPKSLPQPGNSTSRQTKLSNPHYKPEIAAQCTLINFIATERGLEDQRLHVAV